MQKKRPWLSLLIAAVVAAVTPVAWAVDGGSQAAALVPVVPLQAATAALAAEPSRGLAPTAVPPQPRAQTRAERRAAAAKKARAAAPRRNQGSRGGRLATGAAAVGPAPRLQLDAPEPALSEEAMAIDRAIEVVARAASAARLAASQSAQAQGRIGTLERTVGELRKEADGQRNVSEQLRGQLARQDSAGRWFWPLLAAVLLLAGLAVWLARRLVVVQREYQARWLTVAPAPALPGAAIAAKAHGHAVASLGAAELRQLGSTRAPPAAWPPPASTPSGGDAEQVTQPMAAPPAPHAFVPELPMQRTELLPHGGRGDVEDGTQSPRDVSIEELIDLEQQAEFFVVLGQDDSAIELLSEHLRHTGGGSPLPYLKLLEIFRRRGDHGDYERIRSRFNHRFNAYAPEWGSDLADGRSLEDYAGILPRLQQAWPRPLDAMAEMEALLFRKSRGDLFDLPAYRELLFLYSLARDLLDREGADGDSVDLLLPLSNADDRGGDFGSTAPAPFLGLEGDPGPERGEASDERPTRPLDFDLSAEGQRQTSIFDPLDRHGKPGKRS